MAAAASSPVENHKGGSLVYFYSQERPWQNSWGDAEQNPFSYLNQNTW